MLWYDIKYIIDERARPWLCNEPLSVQSHPNNLEKRHSGSLRYITISYPILTNEPIVLRLFQGLIQPVYAVELILFKGFRVGLIYY